MLLQLTIDGKSLLDSNPTQVTITRASFGSAFGYTLPIDPTGIIGAEVYGANAVWAPQIVSPNTIRYILVLDKGLESFEFGEIALYHEDVLLAVGVNQTPINKLGPDLTGFAGDVLRLDFFMDLAPGARYAVADVTSSQPNTAFSRLPIVDLLTPPSINDNNAYVIYGPSNTTTSFLAFADPTGLWSFSNKEEVQITGTITSIGTYGLQSLDLAGTQVGSATDLVVQFTSGKYRGYCRTVSSVLAQGLVWAVPLALLPNVGDSFIVLGPKVMLVGGGGGSGGGGSPFATDILVNSNTYTPGITVGSGPGTGPCGPTYNVALGVDALLGNTSGYDCVAIGKEALAGSTSGWANTVIGSQAARYISTGVCNVALGYHALASNTTGSYNVAIGHVALFSADVDGNNTSDCNIAIGANAACMSRATQGLVAIGNGALAANTVSYNLAIGAHALYSNFTGANNVAVGEDSLYTNYDGGSNTALGFGALYGNYSGSYNVAIGSNAMDSSVCANSVGIGVYTLARNLQYDNVGIGFYALSENISGSNNVAIGSLSQNFSQGNNNVSVGSNSLSQSIGSDNIAVGSNTLSYSTTGEHNIAVGSYALGYSTTGTYNVAVGEFTLSNISTGSHNVGIGYNSGGSISTGSGNVVLGGNSGESISTLDSHIILSDGFGVIRATIDDVGNFDVVGALTVNGSPVGSSGTSGYSGFSQGVRELLTANRTYYVATTGNDANTGLSSGTPFLTVQKALDIAGMLDSGIYDVTLNCADGTYTELITSKGLLGKGSIYITGNTVTPANVLFTYSSGVVIVNQTNNPVKLNGIKVTNTGGLGLSAQSGALITINNFVFGACASGHMYIASNGSITADGNYTISGAAPVHAQITNGGLLQVITKTVTLTGTLDFSLAFIYASVSGRGVMYDNTFIGSATGKRYDISSLSMLFTNNSATTILPGSIAGTLASGGVYA